MYQAETVIVLLVIASLCATGVTNASMGLHAETANQSFAGGDSNEPNDDFRSATPIQSGNTIDAEIDSTNDEDWYQIELSEGSTVQTDLLHLGGSGSLEITYYGIEGSPIFQSTAEGEQSNVQWSWNPPETGTYYIQIDSPDGTAQYQYTLVSSGGPPPEDELTIVDPNEPNDDFSTATQIESGEVIDGEISHTNDVDAFVFQAQGGENLSYSLANYGDQNAALNITLFGPDRNAIPINNLPSFRTRPGRLGQMTVPEIVSPGEYYIVVHAGNGTGTYSLSMELTSNSTSDGGIFDQLGSESPSVTYEGTRDIKPRSVLEVKK